MPTISRRPTVIWDVVDSVTMLCRTDSGELFELNATGAFIWRNCDNVTLAELLERLSLAYPHIEQSQLLADTEQLIVSLKEAELVDVTN
jgi:hypothetical protein